MLSLRDRGPAKKHRKRGSLLIAPFTKQGGYTSTIAAAAAVASRGTSLLPSTAATGATSSSRIPEVRGQSVSIGGTSSSSSSARAPTAAAPIQVVPMMMNEGKAVRIKMEKGKGKGLGGGGLLQENDDGRTTHSNSSSSSRSVSMSMSATVASINSNEVTAAPTDHHRTTLAGSMMPGARNNINSHDNGTVDTGGITEDININTEDGGYIADRATVLNAHIEPSIVRGGGVHVQSAGDDYWGDSGC